MATDLEHRDLAALAARFGRLLRVAGIPATPERSVRFAAAVEVTQPVTVDELYWVARVTLLDQPDQIDPFDSVFDRVFRGYVDMADHRGDATAPPLLRVASRVRPRSSTPGNENDEHAGPLLVTTPGAADAADSAGDVLMTASVEERLRRKDFAAYTDEELAVLRRLIDGLRVVAPQQRSRRTSRAATGARLDVRRTLRRSHRTGGDPVRRDYRKRGHRPRQVVLIADVSGSMEAYSRVYVQLLQGAVRGSGAEAFVMATRLTRISKALAAGRPDVAVTRAVESAPDWSGGTRIGESLKTFLDRYGRRGMARGAVVVIVSDGWERADAAVLGEQMARLRRLAHRVIWVNPRTAAERYEPLVGGMAAALPHVDVLVSGHSVDALDRLLAAISDPTRAP